MLPNALVIGPQKCGTTWIHSYLEKRGDVTIPAQVKETFFFDRYYERGPGWYSEFFDAAPGKCVVEVAPSLFHAPAAPGRVMETLGGIQLICTLRSPVKRLFSLYLHYRRYGLTTSSFGDALRDNPQLLESSRYATHLSRWIEVFGRENLCTLTLEQLAADANTYVTDLCAALDLRYMPVSEDLQQRVYQASLPNSPALARIGLTLSDAMRAFGFYGVINVAKRVGLKRVFFGRPGQSLPELDLRDLSSVQGDLIAELDALERILDHELSEWREDLEQIPSR